MFACRCRYRAFPAKVCDEEKSQQKALYCLWDACFPGRAAWLHGARQRPSQVELIQKCLAPVRPRDCVPERDYGGQLVPWALQDRAGAVHCAGSDGDAFARLCYR